MNMATQPGQGSVPYTHREVFFAARYMVGRGLATYSESPPAKLKNKDTIEDVMDDDDIWYTIAHDPKLWREMKQSVYIRTTRASRFAAEYIAKNTPNNDLETKTFNDVQGMCEYSYINTVSPETIRWLLGVNLSHSHIWNNIDLYRRLLKNNANWTQFFDVLTSYGNPLDEGRWDTDVIHALAMWAIDEPPAGGSRTQIQNVFNSGTNRNRLLQQDNNLNQSYSNVYTSHPRAVRNQSTSSNVPTTNSYGILNGFKRSPYTNKRALALLDQSVDLRRTIGATNLGLNANGFTFEKLGHGDYSKTLLEAIPDLEDEFVHRSSNTKTFDYNDHDNPREGWMRITNDGELLLSGHQNDADDHYGRGTHAEYRTRSIYLGNTSSIQITYSANVDGKRDNQWNVSHRAEIAVGDLDSKRIVKNKNESVTEGTVTFNVSNQNWGPLKFLAQASVDSSHGGVTSPTSARLTIHDIQFQ